MPDRQKTKKRPPVQPKKTTNLNSEEEEEKFSLRKVPEAFTSLPRVMRLVWAASAAMMVMLALINLFQGFAPAVSVTITQMVIDSVVRGIRLHDPNPIWLPVGLQLGVMLLTNLLSTLSNTVQQLLQDKVANQVQEVILEKANSLDLPLFENSEFYDKMRRATDQSMYKPSNMIVQVFGMFRTLVTVLSLTVILVQLAWWLAVIALVMQVPGFISSSRYGWYGYYMQRRQSPKRRLMYYLNELMSRDSYNKEIKLFNLGLYFIEKYKHLAEEFYDENRRLVISRYMIGFLWDSLSVVANSAIYLYVALRAVLDPAQVTLGSLTKYTATVMQVGTNFDNLLSGVSGLYETHLYISLLYDFLDFHPTIMSPELPQPLVPLPDRRGIDVEFRNVSFTYPGKDPVTEATLKNVSFSIRAGEAIALVGRNGAGKTTLVKLLTRLYDPDEGEILVNGRNVKDYALEELREQVGVIFQDYVHYQMTARENIGVGSIADIQNQHLIESSASKSGANTIIEKLPDTYDTILGKWFKNGVQLSGGEWQKVALARAFMRDARILVLDEPTSSLDALAEYEVFTSFRALTEGKSAIFISHRFSTVRLADRIFVLEGGHIIENGSHDALMELDGSYAELFNIQAQAYR